MNGVAPKPEGLSSISKLKVGNARDKALVARGVEEDLRPELIARKASDAIVGEFGERAERLVVVALDDNIASQKPNLRPERQLAIVEGRGLTKMGVGEHIAVIANQGQAVVRVRVADADVGQLNGLPVAADASDRGNL